MILVVEEVYENVSTARKLFEKKPSPGMRRKRPHKSKAIAVHRHEEFLETFNNDPEAAKDAMFSTDWAVAPFKRVIWLGALGWSGHWSTLPYPKDSLLGAIVKNFKLKSNEYELRPECKVQCSHYSKKLSILSIFDNPSFDTGIEEAACAPTVVVPGFMKAASTFLFTAITLHPQGNAAQYRPKYIC